MKRLLERLLTGENLSEPEAADLLVALTDAALPAATSGAILAALRAKGETPDEIRGFATAMRGLALRPHTGQAGASVDVVGTGGDGSGSLNLSTGAALLTAACGRPVIKHGNRSVSSRSGSADVLEALGYVLPPDEKAAGQCLDRCGFTFLFAPYFHPAMKALAPVRRALGVRTVFNMLGPLTNPAETRFGVIGAFSPEAARLMADTLSGLPIERVFVVHGAPGWDEATPVGPFMLFDVRPGRVTRYDRDAQDHGVPRCAAMDLAGGDAVINARRLEDALGGERGAHRDALVLGAGLALEVSGQDATWALGMERAGAAIDDGSARRLIERLLTESSAATDAAEDDRG
jgi:anthranilate phosphoribosyltransferase